MIRKKILAKTENALEKAARLLPRINLNELFPSDKFTIALTVHYSPSGVKSENDRVFVIANADKETGNKQNKAKYATFKPEGNAYVLIDGNQPRYIVHQGATKRIPKQSVVDLFIVPDPRPKNEAIRVFVYEKHNDENKLYLRVTTDQESDILANDYGPLDSRPQSITLNKETLSIKYNDSQQDISIEKK